MFNGDGASDPSEPGEEAAGTTENDGVTDPVGADVGPAGTDSENQAEEFKELSKEGGFV